MRLVLDPFERKLPLSPVFSGRWEMAGIACSNVLTRRNAVLGGKDTRLLVCLSCAMLLKPSSTLFAVAWTLAVVMVAVFIYELVLNSKAQGTPISLKVHS